MSVYDFIDSFTDNTTIVMVDDMGFIDTHLVSDWCVLIQNCEKHLGTDEYSVYQCMAVDKDTIVISIRATSNYFGKTIEKE